jgi:hypothetical protein
LTEHFCESGKGWPCEDNDIAKHLAATHHNRNTRHASHAAQTDASHEAQGTKRERASERARTSISGTHLRYLRRTGSS